MKAIQLSLDVKVPILRNRVALGKSHHRPCLYIRLVRNLPDQLVWPGYFVVWARRHDDLK